MPHKWYQGKTGRVWNVTKRAIGVEINKRVSSQEQGLKDRGHGTAQWVCKPYVRWPLSASLAPQGLHGRLPCSWPSSM